MSEPPRESTARRLGLEINTVLHRDVTLQTRWLILALLIACAAILALGFSQDRSSFDDSDTSIVAMETTLEEQGLSICNTQDVSVDRLQGATEAQAYVLGYPTCASRTNGEDVLTVYRFDSSGARDSATHAFLGGRSAGRGAGFGPQGSLWAYGPYLIALSGQRSDVIDELARHALTTLGAT